MKRFIPFTALLFLLLPFSQAQEMDTLEWAPEGAHWFYIFDQMDCPLGQRILYIKDTVFQDYGGTDITAKKLVYKNYSSTSGGMDTCYKNGDWTAMPNDNSPARYFYEKDDSLFVWREDTFVLVFYFGADTNDVWQIKSAPNDNHPCDTLDYDTLVIDDTNTIEKNNILFKQFKTTSKLHRWGYHGEEGHHGFLTKIDFGRPYPIATGTDSCNLMDRGWWRVSCYMDNKRGYVTGENCDSLFVRVNEQIVPHHEIQVYPNPVSDMLYIDARQADIVHMELRDIYGRKTEVNRNNGQIDVAHLTEGVYILSLTDHQGDTRFFKIIKP